MSQRSFPNFMEAYLEYAHNTHIPPQFNEWSCLSIIAGALERKVWLPWDDTYAFYPNIYVLLVSLPGDGKSIALNKAVGLLQEMNGKRNENRLNVMPNQVTEAKFIELMGNGRSFVDNSSGKELTYMQNAGYYYASEASNSLKNVFGDFIACLTDFYDCPPLWSRATKKDGKTIVLKNVCVNLLAGSTFDYLGKLVSDDNIMGGFASRLLYIVSRNKEITDQSFQLGQIGPEEKQLRSTYRDALVSDLHQISQLTGPVFATPEFGKAWEAWWPSFERQRRSMASEKAQSIMARTNTNVLKVAILLSAAESNDKMLKLHHWEKALALVQGVQEQAPGIFRESRAKATDKTGGNVTNAIMQHILANPKITYENVINSLTTQGFSRTTLTQTMQALLDGNKIGRGNVGPDGAEVTLLCNPDDYL